MKCMIKLSGAVVLTAALATPAAAQVTGMYSGTSADGSALQFGVATDPDTGWGFGLMSDISAARRVRISATDNYYTIEAGLAFSADGQSATGEIMSISPTLAPVGAHPQGALVCVSPNQSLTLTLQPTTATDKGQGKVNQQTVRPNVAPQDAKVSE